MQIKVNVRQDHIDRGTPGLCQSCPVALAVNEALPQNYKLLGVGTYWIVIFNPAGKQIDIPAPICVSNFIDRLDNYGERGQSFNFDLTLP